MKKISLARNIAASVASLALGASLLPMTVAQAAPTAAHDGSSSEKAAASCYEIKQENPNAKSGSYWLFTPKMEAPAQFYCDQETNGGGWVLIGRGREGWTEEWAGKGNANQLASNPDGTDAFTPVQLPSQTVDGLLNGQAPSELSDGVRFKRAANTAGTAWQEVRAKRNQVQNWTWALQAYANWSNISFDNPVGMNLDQTYSTSLGRVGNFNNNMNTMSFTTNSAFSWKLGFSYGQYMGGNTSADSYLWTPTGASAMPFTQVYLRPKVTQATAGFSQIPDSGSAAEQNPQVPNNYSAPMKWRTSNESMTGNTGELNTRVQAIAQVGNTVFTGGDFKNVVSSSGETVNQAFLAGYDVDSAELVRSFTPTFNGQVKSLEGLSNGKLAVGGEFTQVNGENVSGFVVLDPVTGQIDHTFDWKVENRIATDPNVVKTIQEKNGYLYIGGSFTHVKGNTSSSFAYARSAARFKMSDGGVDFTWRPNFNGAVNGISAADDDKAVYAAGYFTMNGTDSTYKLASLDPTTGKRLQDWKWDLSYSNPATAGKEGFQFDVQDAGNTVFTGGAEHIIAQYNKSDLTRLSSSITKSGGDFQDLSRNGNVIFGACHCGDWIYQGGKTHDAPWNEMNNIYSVRLIGAWDATTGKVIPQFNPQISGEKGHGIWESFTDSRGNLWVGGDITRTLGASGTQNTVGFARYTPADVTPAATPTDLTATTVDGKDKLTWKSTAGSSATYEILRNDRVIATTAKGATSYDVDHVDNARYFVRSVDPAGNYSQTTAVASVEVVSPTEPTTPAEPTDPTQPTEPTTPAEPTTPEVKPAVDLIAAGSDWNYLTNAISAPKTWKDTNSTFTSWKTAKAPMGWYTTGLQTALTQNTWGQPYSIFARKDFTIDNLEGYTKAVINVRVDDGAVVYVNGKEVKRTNLATSYAQVPWNAKATKAVSNAEGAIPMTFEVPVSALTTGKNTIAVQEHGNSVFYNGVSFDLSATLQP